MAYQAGNKAKATGAGERPEKGSDTINFTYSAAVEAALEKLESPRDEIIAASVPTKKKVAKPKVSLLRETEEKPKPDVVINKLDEIYQDWVFLRDLNTPRGANNVSTKQMGTDRDVNSLKNPDSQEKTLTGLNNDKDEDRQKKLDANDSSDQKHRENVPERTDTKQRKRDGKNITADK